MSGFGFGITSLGIKCPELVLESQVLESNVRNWFGNYVSCNHMSGIKCLELILELHVLESGVRIWDRKHLSWNQVSWNQVSGFALESGVSELHALRHMSWNQVSNMVQELNGFGIICPNLNRNKCHCNHISGNKHLESNVLESKILESNETHPVPGYIFLVTIIFD